MAKDSFIVHIEAFHAPCCEGAAGQLNEIQLANLLREVERQHHQVEIAIHTLVFGDPDSVLAVRHLTEYLRASRLERIADAGIFNILSALPIISVNGIVRYVGTIPSATELLTCLAQTEATWQEIEQGDTMKEANDDGFHH